MLYALARRGGHKIWSTKALWIGHGLVRCAPAVAEGRVYVSWATTIPMDGGVRAFSMRTGRRLWDGEMADYATSSPAYVNGLVFAGSYDHQLYAFSAATGRTLWRSGWRSEKGLFVHGISSSPAISGGRVFIGIRDGSIAVLGPR
jgi:eukaryotic-like serine/threonine-protein kinase